MSRALPLALLTVLALAAVAGASPQPSPVCGACSTEFEYAAEEYEVNASVAESRAVVQVHGNGSATWTVRNTLERGADAFREDPGLLSQVGRQLADASRGVAENPSLVEARMDGPTVVFVFRDPEAAERHAGLLVVDYLHHGGSVPWLQVNADEFTIHGPPGTVVTNDPGDARVDGGSATWQGSASGPLYEAAQVEETPFIVFGPDRDAGTTVQTRVALAAASLPLFFDRAVQFVVVQSMLFAVVLALVAAAVRYREPTVDVRVVAGLALGLGSVTAVGLAVTHEPGTGAAGVAAIVLGAAALHPAARDRLTTPRRLAVAAALGVLFAWAVGVAVRTTTGADGPVVWSAVRTTAPALPFAAMVPLGATLHGDRRTRVAWGGATVLAFAAMPPLLVDFAGSMSGFFPGFAMLAFAAAAFAFPLVGSVLVVLGWRVAGVDTTAEGDRIDDI